MNVPIAGPSIALPVLLTVVIAVVIGALVVVQDQRQSSQVDEADAVAQDYLAQVGDVPVVGHRQGRGGRRHGPGSAEQGRSTGPSRSHRDWRMRRHTGASTLRRTPRPCRPRRPLLQPFKRLSATLRKADVALEFIVAARKVLELRATDYVGYGFITTSTRVRSELIPAFVRARDEFDRVQVPQGQEQLAKKVHDAAQYVIDQASLLANSIESRQNFSFSYREEFQAAADAVSDYATKVKGDVAEAARRHRAVVDASDVVDGVRDMGVCRMPAS